MARSFFLSDAKRAPWLAELRALAALSGPIALSNLAQLVMGTTDVMMMGVLGADTLAAGALGVNLYFVALIFGIGVVSAASPLIARELGGPDPDAAVVRGVVWRGLWAALCLAIPCWLVLWWTGPLLRAMGQDAALAAAAEEYVRALQWALLPAWCQVVLRCFVTGLERPGWVLVIGLSGIPLNALANWCLLLGHCGCRSMGIAGSGLATSLTAWLMLAALAVVAARVPPFRVWRIFARPWLPSWSAWRGFWGLGLPMAATLSFEVTVFNAAVFLMGLIGAASLAAHAIAIQVASLSFMVPMGIGQAVTVRVGKAFGAGNRAAVGRAGWTGLAMAVCFMAVMSLTMVLTPRTLIAGFIDVSDPLNAEVISLATLFLAYAALFQIADGAQAVGGGMLRGLQDTRAPMLYALAGYWGIGFPLGFLLAFPLRLGGAGLWIGLATGLIIVALLMLRRWIRREDLGLTPPTVVMTVTRSPSL